MVRRMRRRIRFVLSNGWGFIRAVAEVLMTEAGDRIIEEIRATVRRIDGYEWPGEKKRQAAVAGVLLRIGLPRHLVHCLIEIAVAELRKEQEEEHG